MGNKVIDLNSTTERNIRHPAEKLQEKLEEYLGTPFLQVEDHVKEVIGRTSDPLKDFLFRLMYLYQNRVCSILFFLAYYQQCRERKVEVDTLRLAAALEVLHLALTAHEFAWGERKNSNSEGAFELLGGDYLFGEALALASDRPRIIKGMSEVVTRYVEAEFMTLPLKDIPATRKKYLNRLSYREASLLTLSASVGCWRGGGSATQTRKIAYYAHYLGISRQIKRELQEFSWNDKKKLRENPAGLRVTLPLLYALETSWKGEELVKILESGCCTRKQRELLEKEIERSEYQKHILKLLKKNQEKSLQSIEDTRGGKEKDLLKDLATQEAFCD